MKTMSIGCVVKLVLFSCLLMTASAGATSYTLTLNAQGSGTVTPDNTNNLHPAGVVITITAAPNAGWYFANWSGDASGTINPLQVTMNSDLVITGNFLAYPSYTLTLATNGQGTIDLNPAGGSYLSNTLVTATAMPATGWVFAAWSGATNTSANPVSLALNTNVSLTGTFAQLPAFDAQPVSVTNKMGSPVDFSAHAVGTAPLGYQWFFSGGSLTGITTNTTLLLTNVSPGQAGNYWVIATNNYGSATSQVASLTLTNFSGPTNVVNSPDEASLRAAIKLGGWVGLDFNGTVTLSNTIAISNNVILDGSSVTATISGGGAVRLFYVAPGVSFNATNLTLANGACIVTNGTPGTPADAGGIYNDGGSLTLVGCSLTNNSAQSLIFGGLARGGAVFNNGGTLLLYQCVVTTNQVIGGGPNSLTSDSTTGTALGGAIYNTNGTVTVTGCNVSGNLSKSVCEQGMLQGTGLTMGGAVFQTSGSMAIANSGFALNQALGGNGTYSLGSAGPASPAYGGAVAASGGSVTIDYSQFSANAAKGGACGFDGSGASAFGGAIYSAVALTVADSSLIGNQTLAGASIDYHATGLINGFGGAIYNSGAAILNRCAVYSNYVQGGTVSPYFNEATTGFNGLGGGIFNASQLFATNCTIAINSSVGGNGSGGIGTGMSGNAIGGGVFNNTNANFIAMNLTIASNNCVSPSGTFFTNGFAAGLQIANVSGTLRLHNSIIAYSGTNSNAYGPVTDDGYNICSDSSANLSSGSSYNNTDPQLAPLGDYGGPTWCMALLPGSPAIDTGGTAGIPNIDQRGYIRPFGDGPDIGAYEYGSVSLVIPILNITSTPTDVLLSFTASPPSLYRVQCSTNLTVWTDLITNGPFASSTNISQTVSKQGFQSRYFRLLMQ